MDRDVFKDHIAQYWKTQELGFDCERIEFRASHSGTYFLNFMCYNGYLVVTGDCYEAIYCIYGLHPLEWWASCSPDYLAEKLRGLNGCPAESRVWDEPTALKEVTSHVKGVENATEEAKREYLGEAKEHLVSLQDWVDFLGRDDRTEGFFGCDSYEYYDIGMIRNPQIDLQIEGLQKAVKQLKEKGVL